MDNNVLQLILKKLEEIDERVKKIESGAIQIEKKEEEEEKDPFFFKALNC
jgi:hypothetical protein